MGIARRAGTLVDTRSSEALFVRIVRALAVLAFVDR